MLKLSEMNVGETGRIIKVNGTGIIRKRLLDMGVTPSSIVYLRKKAPLGDPIEITIRGYELTLRKEESAFIDVELIGKMYEKFCSYR